jgi:SagB-type dehydrogenase family enzyme
MDQGIGDLFQRETKESRHTIRSKGSRSTGKPETYKRYDNVPKVELPKPLTDGGLPLWESFRRRRTVRRYEEQPVSLAELSQLLWATQGITAVKGDYAFRCTPSAGALYPVETYLAANRVDGLRSGIYHYGVGVHQLAEIKPGPCGRMMVEAAMGQTKLERAAVVFIWSAVVPRVKREYHQRAYRYIYLDAGHIAQNLALAAVSLGLGTCPIGAFFDDEMNGLLGLDGTDETVIYMTTVGRPAPRD